MKGLFRAWGPAPLYPIPDGENLAGRGTCPALAAGERDTRFLGRLPLFGHGSGHRGLKAGPGPGMGEAMRVLFTARVAKLHLAEFHRPYMALLGRMGARVEAAAKNDFPPGESPEAALPECARFYDLPFSRKPLSPDNYRAYTMLRALIRQGGYSLIHCHTPVAAALSRLAARGTGTPVIYTAHGFPFYRGAPLQRWLLYYPIERFLARYTDVLLTMNREDAALARSFPARRLGQVPGVGVDLGAFAPDGARRARARAELGIGPGCCLFLSVGELTRRKNHMAALRALKGLEGDFVYMIAGSGPEAGRLEEGARALGLPFRLLGYREDIPALLSAADVFLFPSRSEGLPLALMEAMAAGLPAVASPVRGNVDLLRPGAGGILAREGPAFREAAEALLRDAAMRRALGEANRRAAAPYSLERALAAMEEEYKRILGPWPREGQQQ